MVSRWYPDDAYSRSLLWGSKQESKYCFASRSTLHAIYVIYVTLPTTLYKAI